MAGEKPRGFPGGISTRVTGRLITGTGAPHLMNAEPVGLNGKVALFALSTELIKVIRPRHLFHGRWPSASVKHRLCGNKAPNLDWLRVRPRSASGYFTLRIQLFRSHLDAALPTFCESRLQVMDRCFQALPAPATKKAGVTRLKPIRLHFSWPPPSLIIQQSGVKIHDPQQSCSLMHIDDHIRFRMICHDT
jgi:hypothetical protein